MKIQRNVAEAIFSQFPSEGYPNVIIEDLTKVYNYTNNNDIKDGDNAKSKDLFFFVLRKNITFLFFFFFVDETNEKSAKSKFLFLTKRRHF